MKEIRHVHDSKQGPVSRNCRKLFRPEKPFVKLRPAYSVKLVFSYVVKGIKIKITAKFRASMHLRFEDTKRIMSPEMRPKSFGTFEKQAPGQARCLNAGYCNNACATCSLPTSLGFPNPPLSSWDGSIEETGTANKKCLMAADVDEKRVATALV